jgi:serine/threonine-protein kinase
MVPRTIGKYRLIEKVGRGGMGTVYRAVDESLERDVAVKILNAEITEPEVIKRFRAEAVTLARLHHPGIAVVHELYQDNGDFFMVMEFVRGETFQQLSERLGQVPLEQALALGAQALDALAYAHRLGVVHRDLKPSNLMLSDTGLVKVMDFGIARIVGSEHLTGDGSMMGTPAYMSPEQVRGAEVDGRADLYSMAVVLYRLLAGRLPFEADTAIAFAQKQLYEPPTPLKTVRPELPPWCEAVLARALEKSPGDRFQTAEEFREALVGSASSSLVNAPGLAAFMGDATTCTVPTPIGILRDNSVEAKRTTGSRPLSGVFAAPDSGQTPAVREPTTQRTVVISGKYFFAGTATIALLLIALLAAIIIVARRPLGIPVADQVAARLAPPAERAPAPASPATATPGSASPSNAASAPTSSPTPAPSTPPAPGSIPRTRSGDAGDKSASLAQSLLPPTPQSSAVSKATLGNAKPPAAPATPAAPNAVSSSGPNASPADRHVAPRNLPPVGFDRLKLLVLDGSRSREQDARIQFADGRIIIIAVGQRLVASLPYEDVLTLSSSRSRQPRWRNANGTDSSADLPGGAFGFLKSDRTWIAIQTRDHTYVLRSARDDIAPLARTAAERTGLGVVTVGGK